MVTNIANSITNTDGADGLTIAFPSNPFVGLRPFNSDEALLFFGRREQTIELMARLHETHFIAVVGSSGCGKSSLVRAGLIPKLRAGFLTEDCDQWLVSMMKPGDAPLRNLAAALIEAIPIGREHRAVSIAAIAKILGCPHEEGKDYPEGQVCPQSPYWAGRDRWAGL